MTGASDSLFCRSRLQVQVKSVVRRSARGVVVREMLLSNETDLSRGCAVANRVWTSATAIHHTSHGPVDTTSNSSSHPKLSCNRNNNMRSHLSPSGHKFLNTVKDNWNDEIITPYYNWDAQSLQGNSILESTRAKGTSTASLASTTRGGQRLVACQSRPH